MKYNYLLTRRSKKKSKRLFSNFFVNVDEEHVHLLDDLLRKQLQMAVPNECQRVGQAGMTNDGGHGTLVYLH